MTMKTVLAAVAMLGLTASGSLSGFGHDMVQKETTQSVASLDMSTTASTLPETIPTEEVEPAKAD